MYYLEPNKPKKPDDSFLREAATAVAFAAAITLIVIVGVAGELFYLY